MTEKIPSSVKLGSRPRIFLIRSYSSGVRPCFATRSGVTFGSVVGLVIDPDRLTNVTRETTREKGGAMTNRGRAKLCRADSNRHSFVYRLIRPGLIIYKERSEDERLPSNSSSRAVGIISLRSKRGWVSGRTNSK